MRPRTKLQLRVTNLSSQLPNIESLMIDWAKNECLKHIGYATKSRKQVTVNAREHAYSNGTLKKGTRVTCKEAKRIGDDVWIRTPSGWIAAYYSGKKYVG